MHGVTAFQFMFETSTSLDICQERFLYARREVDPAPHPVDGRRQDEVEKEQSPRQKCLLPYPAPSSPTPYLSHSSVRLWCIKKNVPSTCSTDFLLTLTCPCVNKRFPVNTLNSLTSSIGIHPQRFLSVHFRRAWMCHRSYLVKGS